jgi:hypothetical protein
MRKLAYSGVGVALITGVLLFAASSAFAVSECSSCKPWWHLTSGSRPSKLKPGATGQVVLTAANLGDATADGESTGGGSPIIVTDTLPAGLEVVSVKGHSTNGFGGYERGPVKCKKESASTLNCSFEGLLPPYTELEVVIAVKVSLAARAGEENQGAASGGGTIPAQISRPIAISGEPIPFGISAYELSNEEAGGAPDTTAGSHPFQQTTTIDLNEVISPTQLDPGRPVPAALPKDLSFHWPPGLIGNPTPIPRCTLAQFLTRISSAQNACPSQTAVGVIMVTVTEPQFFGPGVKTLSVPINNLEPAFGQPARLGFYIAPISVPVLITPALRDGAGGDYGLDVNVPDIIQSADFLASKAVVWGVPGDPRHDASRGPGCLRLAFEIPEPGPCENQAIPNPPAFFILPTSCSGTPLQTSVQGDSWLQPTVLTDPFAADPAMPALDGCNHLSFSPAISAEPTTDKASAPSGLDFNIDFHDEGLTSAKGLAQSQLNKTVVTLPEGFTINPSAGVGLAGCTPADYARETVGSAPGVGCPNESKLGVVEISTPLLTQKIHGNIFIAQPHENPFGSLVALYVVAKNPETGVLIKLAGKVTPDPVTGQLVTTFENNPQLAFDHFNFHFREGQQAPLITPPACGTYTTTAQLTPWSEPLAPLTETSSFTITHGFDGGPCPSGGAPPFHPGIQSGTLNNNAGAFSPFYLHLTRTDGEQEISGFSTNLPPGLTGSLTGIPFCPEANIALARTKTGGEEEANPSCPAASQVGHTLVGTGVGAVLAYVPGKIYLAGPFHGAPFSLVSVTSAVVGPFDLGTVVLRFGLNIDPYTAQVSVSPTSSEPIPTIIQGIVTHVRDIRVYIDRQNFTLNPTSCNPLAIGSTLSSPLGASTTVTSPFQAASCANLKFAPKFAVSTSGKTSKQNGASLHVNLTYPQAPAGTYANIAKVKVELPKQLPSRLTTLQKACTTKQFEANPAGCPSESAIGTAKAVVPNIPEPLAGPVYFVSHGGEAFPSLEIVLQGYGVKVILVGATFISPKGITSTTFKSVPDNPVTSFELTLPQGPFSALGTNKNLCALNHTVTVKKKVHGHIKKTKKTVGESLIMPTEFIAQNGVQIHQSTHVSVTGCPKAAKAKKAKAGKKGKKK